MKSSLKTIVYSILEAVYAYKLTDDIDISEEYVKKKVNDVNVRLIEEASKQGENLDNYYQKICCVEVKCEQTSCEINGVQMPSGDVVWYADIPALNSKIGYKNIIYLGDASMDNGWKRTSFTGFMSKGILDWTKGPLYTVVGN